MSFRWYTFLYGGQNKMSVDFYYITILLHTRVEFNKKEPLYKHHISKTS